MDFEAPHSWQEHAAYMLDGCAILNHEGVFLRANARCAQMLGLTQEQITQQNIFEHVPESARVLMRWRWTHELLGQGQTITFYEEGVEAEAIMLEWRVACLDGAVVLNLRAMNETLDELNAQTNKLRRLYEETPVMLHSIDARGRLIQVSELWLEKLGYEREQVLGRSLLDFVKPAHHVNARESMSRVLGEQGWCKDVSMTFLTRQGGELPVLLSATAQHDSEGNVLRTFAFLMDVTEYTRVSEALSESDALMDAFFEAVPLATLITDTERTILRVNEAMVEMLGYTREELLGRKVPDVKLAAPVLSQDDLPQGDEPALRHTRSYTRANGKSFPGDSIIAPIRSHRTRHIGYLELTRDISSELLMLETIDAQREGLQLQNTALLEKNEELKRFAFVASHDLQEPLRKVTMFAQLLQQRLGTQQDAEIQMCLEHITDGSLRMKELIRDLLHYSRLNHNTYSAELKAVSTDEIVALGLQSLVREPPCLHLPQASFMVRGHAGLLGQLMTNLLSNAIKYGPADKELEIFISFEQDDDGNICGRVRDNGIGIDAKFHEKIFEIFQRLHSEAEYSGTGIGLALCKQIVSIHGGRMGVESVSGEGTLFWFSLPQHRE